MHYYFLCNIYRLNSSFFNRRISRRWYDLLDYYWQVCFIDWKGCLCILCRMCSCSQTGVISTLCLCGIYFTNQLPFHRRINGWISCCIIHHLHIVGVTTSLGSLKRFFQFHPLIIFQDGCVFCRRGTRWIIISSAIVSCCCANMYKINNWSSFVTFQS